MDGSARKCNGRHVGRDEHKPSPTPLSTLEGTGVLMVIGGLLVWVGMLTTPAAWRTFLPIGALGSLAGIAMLWIGRRRAAVKTRHSNDTNTASNE